jgi:hypothetical protein
MPTVKWWKCLTGGRTAIRKISLERNPTPFIVPEISRTTDSLSVEDFDSQ